jgi:hypothetical protein
VVKLLVEFFQGEYEGTDIVQKLPTMESLASLQDACVHRVCLS